LAIFDAETVEKLRRGDPRSAYQAAKSSIYQLGGAGSEDFLEAFEQLVDAGVLTWEQIEEYERS
jgi:hypothetical protein